MGYLPFRYLFQGLIQSHDTQNGTISYVQLHQMLFNPYTLYTDTGSKNSMKSAMDTLVHTVDPHVTTEVRFLPHRYRDTRCHLHPLTTCDRFTVFRPFWVVQYLFRVEERLPLENIIFPSFYRIPLYLANAEEV